MQGSRKNQQRSRKTSSSTKNRVVDLREFRRRRKTESWKAGTSGFRTVLYWIAISLCFLVLVFGVGGFIASHWRIQSILWAMFCATIGLVVGIWLNTLHDRRAPRILGLLCVGMLLAYVAGILKVGF